MVSAMFIDFQLFYILSRIIPVFHIWFFQDSVLFRVRFGQVWLYIVNV